MVYMVYHKIVIIGGGFGGLNVATHLKNAPVEVILIDKMNHHLFQPLLYQVATAALNTNDIATPLREIVSKQKNVTVLMGEVVAVDKEQQKILLSDGSHLTFDALILAPGNHQSYFGHDAWEKHAPGLKTLQDAIYIQEKILLAFEEAEKAATIEERETDLRFIVVGGGPTGVEMAGAIAEIANEMTRDFRNIKSSDAKIYLVEAGPQILPSFPKKLSNKAVKTLEKMGVEVITGKKVTDITEEGVWIEGELFKAKTTIWAAGNKASPLLKTLNMPLDRQGRVLVEKDLSLADHPNIFVIGDSAAIKGKELPAIAPVAIQQGRYLAKVIKTGKRKPFKYFDKGQLATIGRTKAVGTFRKVLFSGFLAWLVWAFVHIAYLIDFRNKVFVLVSWAFLYFTGSHGSRIIPSPIEDLKNKISDSS